MKKRSLKKNYKYERVFDEESQIFRWDLYERIGLKKLFSKKRIMDLGCGYGPDSINFAKFASLVVGVDLETHKDWSANSNRKIKFVKADSSKLPFKENYFDGVFLKDLLHHLKNVEETLAEIKRVTKNKGCAVIVEGNRYNPLFYIYSTKIRGHDHFTQKEFKRLISAEFPNVKYIHLEAYPPFRLPKSIYSGIIFLEKLYSKIPIIRFMFSYNVAIIVNDKISSVKNIDAIQNSRQVRK